MAEGTSTGLAAIAWLVAAALALGVGGAAFALASHRRRRELEGRLRRLERAAGEFCEALRARVAVERSRADGTRTAGDLHSADGQETG